MLLNAHACSTHTHTHLLNESCSRTTAERTTGTIPELRLRLLSFVLTLYISTGLQCIFSGGLVREASRWLAVVEFCILEHTKSSISLLLVYKTS